MLEMFRLRSMLKKVLLMILIFALLISGYFLFNQKVKNRKEVVPTRSSKNTIKVSSTPTEADYVAGFLIYTNGTRRIFTASMYHDLSEDIYIDSRNPNVVNVKKPNQTWNDFFKTLPFSLTKDCLITGTGQTFCTGQNGDLKFYINGKNDPDVLNKIIEENDRLLVSFGSESKQGIEDQIQELEAVSLN